ncbi:flagellar basal body P-ring formation chaperone FlgA [Nocardiopsis sp. Huas11]|nr:flagellar basal body P-ring formation chaperone FlgA [Nocardiopsis sp. Huas11]
MATATEPHSTDRQGMRSRLAPTRRRGWKRPFAGVAVVVLGGIVAAWAAGHEDERVPMVVTAHDITAGDVLTDADVRVMHALGVEELDLVPADGAVGERVAVPVPAGTVLTGAMLADTAAWPKGGHAVLAVDAPLGMLPASAREGSSLQVLGAEEGNPLPARLHSLGEEGEMSGSRVIELLVAAEDAAAVSNAVAEPGARLVLMSEEQEAESTGGSA